MLSTMPMVNWEKKASMLVQEWLRRVGRWMGPEISRAGAGQPGSLPEAFPLPAEVVPTALLLPVVGSAPGSEIVQVLASSSVALGLARQVTGQRSARSGEYCGEDGHRPDVRTFFGQGTEATAEGWRG